MSHSFITVWSFLAAYGICLFDGDMILKINDSWFQDPIAFVVDKLNCKLKRLSVKVVLFYWETKLDMVW